LAYTASRSVQPGMRVDPQCAVLVELLSSRRQVVLDTVSAVGLLVHWVCFHLVEPVFDAKIVHLGR
jgi:hypothetical protein